MVNNIGQKVKTTVALLAAGVSGLFAQDSALNNVLENRGYYEALNKQAEVYNLPAESVKNFANSYISEIENDSSRVTYADTVKTRGESDLEHKAAMVKNNDDRDVNLLTKETYRATKEEIENVRLHVEEDRLENYLNSKGVSIPEDDAYVDALQQANISVMGKQEPAEEKTDSETSTSSCPFALGAGVANVNNQSVGSVTLQARLYDGERFNLYSSATALLGGSDVSDFSETESGEMDIREPSMLPDTYIGEKRITERTADLTKRVFGGVSLTGEYELGAGVALGLGPTVMLGHTSYDNQQSRETLETYVGSQSNEEAMTQNGFEKDPAYDDNFASDKVNTLIGGNASLRYKNVTLDVKAARGDDNSLTDVSLLYNF